MVTLRSKYLLLLMLSVTNKEYGLPPSSFRLDTLWVAWGKRKGDRCCILSLSLLSANRFWAGGPDYSSHFTSALPLPQRKSNSQQGNGRTLGETEGERAAVCSMYQMIRPQLASIQYYMCVVWGYPEMRFSQIDNSSQKSAIAISTVFG